MDFVPCPRCQEMNPPNVVKCAACGASMDEEPIEVKPLGIAQEVDPEPEQAAPPVDVPAPPPRLVGVPPVPPGAAPLHAVPPPAAAPRVGPPPDVAAQAGALEQQIAARPDAKGLYIKLADLYQNAGQKDAAIAVLERLLGVDPGNALAKHRVDVLRGTVRHASPPVAAVHPIVRPARPARPAARRGSSRRGLFIGLGVAAVVLAAGAFWLSSGPRRLVAGRSPVFSPQGDRVAFLADQGNARVLSVYDLKTGDTRAIGNASAFGGQGPAWSPDGRQIAFEAPAEGEMGEDSVFVADADTGAKRELATGTSPTWSPDGQSVGMFCHERPRITASIQTDEGEMPTEFGGGWSGVCLVGVADGSVRRLHAGTGSRLSFSPQGQTLVLERFPDELPDSGAAAGAGGDDELQALADEAVAGGATNFYEGSRDLARAAEARGLNKRGAGGLSFVAGDLFALDADTGAVTALTSDGHSSSPRWTAEGRIVYVHQPRDVSRAELWVMGADGSGKQPLVRAPIELFDPGAIAVGGDRVVYAAPVKDVDTGLAQLMTGEAAADLHLVRPGDEAPRRLENRHTFKQRFTLSTDGRRLVYEANDRKTGQSELWLMKP
jgi:dipeptidyl aminopeptidase/acylaminoacyl peptidase